MPHVVGAPELEGGGERECDQSFPLETASASRSARLSFSSASSYTTSFGSPSNSSQKEKKKDGSVDTSKQLSAVLWIFLAVAAILVGIVVIAFLFRSSDRNPFAISQAIEIVSGVSSVVGTAGEKAMSA